MWYGEWAVEGGRRGWRVKEESSGGWRDEEIGDLRLKRGAQKFSRRDKRLDFIWGETEGYRGRTEERKKFSTTNRQYIG
jgi:hypothetical protein